MESLFPMAVTAKQSACLHLHPQAFSLMFFLLSSSHTGEKWAGWDFTCQPRLTHYTQNNPFKEVLLLSAILLAIEAHNTRHDLTLTLKTVLNTSLSAPQRDTSILSACSTNPFISFKGSSLCCQFSASAGCEQWQRKVFVALPTKGR